MDQGPIPEIWERLEALEKDSHPYVRTYPKEVIDSKMTSLFYELEGMKARLDALEKR